MVSSIVPGAAGANSVSAEQRLVRTHSSPTRQQDIRGDLVDISPSSLKASQDSVRQGLQLVHTALAIGHDAQSLLVQAQSLARSGGSQADFSRLLSAFGARLDAAIAQGAGLLAGEDLAVEAEPGAAALVVPGADLRLGGPLISVAEASEIDAGDLPEALQRSLERLQEAMGRLQDSARALEAHQGFLSAAVGASATVRHDLDADGARLLALQVRQGLEGVQGLAIANVEPQAVLSLFRA